MREPACVRCLQRRAKNGGRLRGGDSRAGTLPLELPPPGVHPWRLCPQGDMVLLASAPLSTVPDQQCKHPRPDLCDPVGLFVHMWTAYCCVSQATQLHQVCNYQT
jgi:hypothetical protein